MSSSSVPSNASISLDQQLAEFRQRRFLTMPLAGILVWSVLILTGMLLSPKAQVLAVFIGTGSIVYVAMFLSKLTGEQLKFESNKKRNFFDTLFLSAVAMSFLCYALAIPFFLEDYRSPTFYSGGLNGFDVVAAECVDKALGWHFSRGSSHYFMHLGLDYVSRT